MFKFLRLQLSSLEHSGITFVSVACLSLRVLSVAESGVPAQLTVSPFGFTMGSFLVGIGVDFGSSSVACASRLGWVESHLSGSE